MVNLSTYYPEKSEKMKELNLVAASRGYTVALSNLGVHYLHTKDKKKSDFWFKLAGKNVEHVEKEEEI